MKKFFTIRLHLLAILAAITIVSCTSDTVDTEPVIPVTPQTRAIPTPTFDWANAEWMPVPAGQSAIPSPWNGAGSISYTYGMDITNDRYPNAGWELLYNTFDANASGPLVNPYFVLYNKYRGILRIYLYLTTEFVATSSYLQDGISVVSDHQTSLLSFLGKEIIDPEERYATTDYIQIQGSPDNISPMAANKWYMMQYELAYDPDITSKAIATLVTLSTPLKTPAPSTGTAVLTGIGKNFITENARDETTDSLGRNNNLGLPNYIYSSISNTINSALSGSLDEIPQALFKGFNAIFGLNKTTQPIPINLTFKSQIELNGDLSDRGSFPSSPSSFWLPGTDIASDAVGYIPLYNKPLGVLGLDGRPKVSPMVIYQRVSDGYKLFVTYKTNTFRQRLQYNPEVEAIADIQLTKLELIETDFQGRFTQVCPNRFFAGTLDTNYNPTSSIDVPEYLAFRATFKITPNNGDEPTVIIKTFKTDQDPLPLKNAQ